MAENASERPSLGAVGRMSLRRSAISVAAVSGLLMAANPVHADDSQVIEQMKAQIQELQKKLDDVIAAQKKTEEQQQKAATTSGPAPIVNGNSKLKLTVSGQIDRGLLVYDDSHQTN